MVNEKILFVGVLVIILLGVIPLVIAVDDLISLQGNERERLKTFSNFIGAVA